MHDIDPNDLIEFAKAWSALGDTITEQVVEVVENPSCGSCWDEGSEQGVNPAAIEMARERLGGLSDGLDEILGEFLERAGR